MSVGMFVAIDVAGFNSGRVHFFDLRTQLILDMFLTDEPGSDFRHKTWQTSRQLALFVD